ncbi:MAG: hypothetical protein DME24_05655 [Verrucomicrobia bacterium]|nr:MAG: hypothetical protein DME24_05655 [Verrucomicrobiota bacterium]
MNKQRSVEPVRKKRTIFYSSPQSGERPFEFYMHMFPEDLSLGIMPIGGRSKRKGFKITISPPDKRAEEIIAAGLDRRNYRNSVVEAVCDFFRMVAANLCSADRAMFEIVYFEEPETRKLTGFELVLIYQSQLIEKGGQIYQRVPPDIAKERNVSELILLPSEDLIEFKPPVDFETPLRDVRANLSRLDRQRFPELALIAIEKKIPYDFKSHERSMKLALVEAVKPIGWNARRSFNDCVTSYYWIRLMLTFEKFKIELRHAILAALNDALKRIGQKLGFAAQIEISGLPMRVDVTDAVRKLDSGEIPFTEVMKAFDLR